MTVVDLEAVHEAAAEQLRSRLQRAGEFNISACPDSGLPLPCIEVWPSDERWIGYYEEGDSDDGVCRVGLRVRVEISTDDASAFKVMSDLASRHSTSSIRAALMADRTLGGVVDDLVVLSAGGYQLDERGVHSMWIPVEVVAVMDGPN